MEVKMVKKIITLVVFIVSVVALYRIGVKDTTNDGVVFLSKTVETDRILLENKNWKEMGQNSIDHALSFFEYMFGFQVELEIQPIERRLGPILWGSQNNIKPKIIIYEKHGMYFSSAFSARLVGYLLSLDLELGSYQDYIDDKEIHRKILEEEDRYTNGYLALLTPKYEVDVDTIRFYRDRGLPIEGILYLYSCSLVHFAVIDMVLKKYDRLVQQSQVFSSTIIMHEGDRWSVVQANTDKFRRHLIGYSKNPTNWPLAFTVYHQERNWLYISVNYYRDLVLFFSGLIVIVLSFIQFFRKDLKQIIREELAKEGVSLTNRLVYSIFWQNWKCLIYQAKEEKTRAAIKIIAHETAERIRDKQTTRKARELWNSFKKAGLEASQYSTLEGTYRKATDKTASWHNRLNALNVLRDHRFLLSVEPLKQTAAPEKIKKMRGESKREVLLHQLGQLIDLDQILGIGLSVNNLRNLILAVETLPKVDPFALSALLDSDLGKLLNNSKFTSALFFEDEAIIKDCLGLESKDKLDEPIANGFTIDSTLLAGKRVIITGGRKVDRRGEQLITWTSMLGAKESRYISGSQYQRLGKAAQEADLVILVRPLDHSTQWTVQSQGVQYIWVNHFSKDLYLREVTQYTQRLLAA
ncbi:hypothetical protein ACFLZY_02575 [Patescibacteria group bacterium]